MTYSYNNECFAPEPECSYPGESPAEIKKQYHFGRFGDMVVSTHVDGSVSVYYAPSCLHFHVEKCDSQKAWDFAHTRKHHLSQIGA